MKRVGARGDIIWAHYISPFRYFPSDVDRLGLAYRLGVRDPPRPAIPPPNAVSRSRLNRNVSASGSVAVGSTCVSGDAVRLTLRHRVRRPRLHRGPGPAGVSSRRSRLARSVSLTASVWVARPYVRGGGSGGVALSAPGVRPRRVGASSDGSGVSSSGSVCLCRRSVLANGVTLSTPRV